MTEWYRLFGQLSEVQRKRERGETESGKEIEEGRGNKSNRQQQTKNTYRCKDRCTE